MGPMAQAAPMEPWSERELKMHLLHLHLNPLPLILPLFQLLYLPLNPQQSLCLLQQLLLLHLLLQLLPQPPPHLQAQLPLLLLAGGTHLVDTVPDSGSLVPPAPIVREEES